MRVLGFLLLLPGLVLIAALALGAFALHWLLGLIALPVLAMAALAVLAPVLNTEKQPPADPPDRWPRLY